MRTGFRLRRWVLVPFRRLGAVRLVLAVRLTRRLTVRRLVRDFLTNRPSRLRTILGLALLPRRFFRARLGLATRVTLVAVAIVGSLFQFPLTNSRVGA